MNLTKILTVVLFAASVFLAYKLYRSVQGTIEEKELITSTEEAIVQKLKLIREAEIVFQSVNGRYTANWDSLADFIQHGRVPIVQRREVITQKSYGVEDVQVFVDTLGFDKAIDRICFKKHAVNASDNGIFLGYKVKEGSMAIKNQKAYTIKVGEKDNDPPFQDQGIVIKLEPVNVGDEVKKGQPLISLQEQMFNPDQDFTKIGDIPGQEGKKFDIFVGMIDRSGVKVQAIEVKDPNPINPERKEDNEAKNRKPLRFGSRLDVSTSGNWE